MTPNEARRGEGMPDAEGGDKVQQAVNMAPLGWMPVAAGSVGDQGSNQTGVPGEGAMVIRTGIRRMIPRRVRDRRTIKILDYSWFRNEFFFL